MFIFFCLGGTLEGKCRLFFTIPNPSKNDLETFKKRPPNPPKSTPKRSKIEVWRWFGRLLEREMGEGRHAQQSSRQRSNSKQNMQSPCFEFVEAYALVISKVLLYTRSSSVTITRQLNSSLQSVRPSMPIRSAS